MIMWLKRDNMIYGIETNFYGSGGSKLNETARSYKTLALETDTIDGFTFVWFTDGTEAGQVQGTTLKKHLMLWNTFIISTIWKMDNSRGF